MLTQGNRGSFCPTCFCLSAPGLLAASTLSFHPVCLTSLLCMYPCLSLKKITSEQLFQRGQILFGPSSPGSGRTSTRVNCLWPSLQIPSSPTHFYRLTLGITLHHHPLNLLQGARLWLFPVQTETCWVCEANHSPRCLDLPLLWRSLPGQEKSKQRIWVRVLPPGLVGSRNGREVSQNQGWTI